MASMLRGTHVGRGNTPQHVEDKPPDSEGRQHFKDVLIYEIKSADLSQSFSEYLDGFRRCTFFWRPPGVVTNGEQEIVDERGSIRHFEELNVELVNISKEVINYTFDVPGEYKNGDEEIVSMCSGALGAKGSGEEKVNITIGKEAFANRNLLMRGRRLKVQDEHLGSYLAEFLNAGRLALYCRNPKGATVAMVRVVVGIRYESKGGSSPGFGNFFFVSTENSGERTTEGAVRAVPTTLTHLPDDGYPQIGFVINNYNVKLQWFRQGKPVADFRWRTYEDGDTRLSIPAFALVVGGIKHMIDWEWGSSAGAVEWGFDQDRSVWSSIESNGSERGWPADWYGQQYCSVGSHIPVIVYDRRYPTYLSGEAVQALVGKTQASE